MTNDAVVSAICTWAIRLSGKTKIMMGSEIPIRVPLHGSVFIPVQAKQENLNPLEV